MGISVTNVGSKRLLLDQDFPLVLPYNSSFLRSKILLVNKTPKMGRKKRIECGISPFYLCQEEVIHNVILPLKRLLGSFPGWRPS